MWRPKNSTTVFLSAFSLLSWRKKESKWKMHSTLWECFTMSCQFYVQCLKTVTPQSFGFMIRAKCHSVSTFGLSVHPCLPLHPFVCQDKWEKICLRGILQLNEIFDHSTERDPLRMFPFLFSVFFSFFPLSVTHTLTDILEITVCTVPTYQRINLM